MPHRSLTEKEISTLNSHGCSAEDWKNIWVKEDFSADKIKNTHFAGTIKLGNLSGITEVEKGISKTCGIFDSYIRNCEIDDNVHISSVKNLVNYCIEKDVALINVGSLMVNGDSTFGNGTEVEVLNEGGGRELPIFDRLTSQMAYLAVLYRHDLEFTNKLLGLIREYTESKRAGKGIIQSGTRIKDTLIIRNVKVGSHAIISGACLLEEGTINSCKEAPAYIGEGVIAKKFIILSGSRVESGAMLDKCFVGQGVKMGKQYSAENSLFFANCEAFHGEACSLFAGPFTVTHHKSTLLIASLFSFFNAGSGTNQSNHMYKLGPVHQGTFGRGSKTGSFAYLLLPSVVGAYSVVMGKHYANFDTSDFPFSYITEEKGKSELTPAMNIFTVGTRRDSEKWPARDNRKDPEKLDLIHYDLFNPYIIGRMVNGINILNELGEKASKEQDLINYKGINIHRLLLKTARKYYEMALKVYMGQEIVKRINGIENDSSLIELQMKLNNSGVDGKGKWVDICGLFSPASKIDELFDQVKSGYIKSISKLSKSLVHIYDHYAEYSWNWCSNLIEKQSGVNLDQITCDGLIGIINEWRTNAVKLNNMILKDAEKEFDSGSKLGFGIDGDQQTRDMDFQAVRGVYEKNKFVLGLQKEILDIQEKADRFISILEKMK